MNSVPLWVTLFGFAAPLLTLAGTAVAYVIKVFQDRSDRRRNDFFELMKMIDSKDFPIATKVAAVYQLRMFPQHREFTIRFCEQQQANVTGNGASTLINEMQATKKALEQDGKWPR